MFEVHPICEAFPRMTDAELRELAADIKANGLKIPVVTHRGKVIDGRNRLLACEIAGVEPMTTEWDGRGSLATLVISLNERRRHLTASQRGMIAAELKPFIEAEIAEETRRKQSAAGKSAGRSRARNEKQQDQSEKVLGNIALDLLPGPRKARDEAAASVGVSPRYVSDAEQIKKADARVAEAVKRGEKTIPEARRDLGLAPPRPATSGHTKVNGSIVADPPEIARARKAGRIPANAVVEIEEPEETSLGEDVRGETEASSSADETDLSDEEWLALLPLSKQLTGSHLKVFQADALVYRNIEKARKVFAHHFARFFKATHRKGAYTWRVKSFLGIEHPSRWHLCPAPEHGGCDGHGQIDMLGSCPKCKGRGYWIA